MLQMSILVNQMLNLKGEDHQILGGVSSDAQSQESMLVEQVVEIPPQQEFANNTEARQAAQIKELSDSITNNPYFHNVLTNMVNQTIESQGYVKVTGNNNAVANIDQVISNVTPVKCKNVQPSVIRSPSESTIYVPALNQIMNQGQDNIIDKISNFVEEVRIETTRQQRSPAQGHPVGQETERMAPVPGTLNAQNVLGQPELDSSVHVQQPDGLLADDAQADVNEGRLAADRILLESEKYKAAIAAPQGNPQLNNNSIEWLCKWDSDDDFFHLTCHVDPALRAKIIKGEFVDLTKLLPKERGLGGSGQAMSDGSILELITKGGHTYFAPAKENDAKINNVCKWDAAFHVYAAIYSEANPTHAAEIWQYVYVIHKAASNFVWDNVSYYDITFRQLMSQKLWRSWSKTYAQAWNLAMVEPLNKSSSGKSTHEGSSLGGLVKYHDWRDDCCWKFNRNKCSKSNADCHYDHCCTYCGGWNHGYYNCRKRLGKQKGQGQNNNNPGNKTYSGPMGNSGVGQVAAPKV